MKHRKPRTSSMAQVLAPYFDNLPVDKFSFESCGAKGTCNFAPGIEHLFVFQSAFASFESLKAKVPSLAPCQMMYMPHSTSEKGGFDLSLGTIATNNRILVMHKLKSETWCDAEWRWNSTGDGKAHGQIAKLLNHHLEEKLRLPYIALHTCYCLHEYRRMGGKTEGVDVPAFSHPVRSVFVDLRPILQVDKWQEKLRQRQVHVEVKHRQNEESVQSTLVSSGDGKQLAVLEPAELPSFLAVVVKHLAT